MNSDSKTELEAKAEPVSNEGSKTAIVPGKNKPKPITPGALYSSSSEQLQEPRVGRLERLSSINPCYCCCLGCNFLIAYGIIAAYEVVTSFLDLIRGGLHGVLGVLAALIIVGVCLCEKFVPVKSKLVTYILAILCWVSCVLLLVSFSLTLAIITSAFILFNKYGTRPPYHFISDNQQDIDTILFLGLVATTIHSLFCIYFIFCKCILSFKILLGKKKLDDAPMPTEISEITE